MINSDFISITLMLPKIGRKTAFKIFNHLNYKISNIEDLYDFLIECSESIKSPEIKREDFLNTVLKFEQTQLENEKIGVKTVSFYDEEYPKRFINESDPPILLYCLGNIDLLNHPNCVGIVGTRHPSELGFKLGKNVGKYFSEAGYNIVSGLAVGSDTSAHLGALDGGGKTTAFLAHGLQTIYPKENRKLAEIILENNGLLVSEYFTGTPPLQNYFVERDRLQSYLSDLLIVVQTDIKGGTMHAVNQILNSNKILAAIFPEKDNFKNHPKSNGNEFLIKEKGAIPIRTMEDIKSLMGGVVFNDSSTSISTNSSVSELEILKDKLSKNDFFDKDEIQKSIYFIENELKRLSQQQKEFKQLVKQLQSLNLKKSNKEGNQLKFL